MIYIINFKTYQESTGINAIKLAEIIEDIRKEKNAEIYAVPQSIDIRDVAKITKTLAQHIDPILPGANTGSTLPNSVKDAGATGTLINHAERKLSFDKIEGCVNIAKQLGLKTICCAADINEVMEISKFKPDYIAYEDPELIGSGKSILKEKPEIITRFVEVLKELNSDAIPLCGAGG
ncbi:MAG: triose-phosphate isomerase, partial [Candidatus Aenigmarchaeota archaeon]|nr:triose-phosphate isomerase [Candidatus Aenigmarchaeota archaeon]